MLHKLPKAQALLNPALLLPLFKEQQGLTFTVIDGVAAGTAMTVAAIRPEDTILSAIKFMDIWAAPTDDKANITIQSDTASGTVSIAGNPVDGETVTVRGVVYTFKTAPSAITHAKITAGDNTAMAATLAGVINGYETRYESQLNGDGARTPLITASSALGVVTIKSIAPGAVGNAYTLSKVATNVTVSGATLAGGSDIGAIKSTTDLSVATIVLVWVDKK